MKNFTDERNNYYFKIFCKLIFAVFRIDVDAELEKLDQEDKEPKKKSSVSGGGLRSKPSIPDTVPLAGLTDDEKRIKADKEKDKGNEVIEGFTQ